MGLNSTPTLWSALAQAVKAALTNATTVEELQRRSTPDADGLLPSDHVVQAINEHLSRMPGIVLCEV